MGKRRSEGVALGQPGTRSSSAAGAAAPRGSSRSGSLRHPGYIDFPPPGAPPPPPAPHFLVLHPFPVNPWKTETRELRGLELCNTDLGNFMAQKPLFWQLWGHNSHFGSSGAEKEQFWGLWGPRTPISGFGLRKKTT